MISLFVPKISKNNEQKISYLNLPTKLPDLQISKFEWAGSFTFQTSRYLTIHQYIQEHHTKIQYKLQQQQTKQSKLY